MLDNEGYDLANKILKDFSVESWEKLRNGKGSWPEESQIYMRFRHYNIGELKNSVDAFESRGKINFIYYLS